jgi:hypothetical protein
MSLSAPTRLDALRDFAPANLAHRRPPARLPVRTATVTGLPSTPAAPAQHILMVAFTSPDGRAWHAIGGGDTPADAVAFAQESCPTDATWQAVSWSELHGD